MVSVASNDVNAKEDNPKTKLPFKPPNPNTKHCNFDTPDPPKQWTWPEAKLAFTLKQDEKGVYREDSVLFSNRNINKRVPIASIAKTMATLVIFDMIDAGKLSLDEKIPVRPESLCLIESDFATRKLQPNLKEITVGDALTHANRLSSNPMVYNLAFYIARNAVDESQFVALMNEKARRLDMKDTHFLNPHGLPQGDRKSEYTTANDLEKLATYMIPYFERFQDISNRPLAHWMEDQRIPSEHLKTQKSNVKEELRQLGAVFKTASISGCKSLLSMIKQADKIGISIHLCAPDSNERFNWGLSMMKKMKSVFVTQQEVSYFVQPLPQDPPSVQ